MNIDTKPQGFTQKLGKIAAYFAAIFGFALLFYFGPALFKDAGPLHIKSVSAAACVAKATANWNVGSTWNTCSVNGPVAGDTVTIPTGFNVTIPTGVSAASAAVTIDDGGTLTITSTGQLTSTGNLTVNGILTGTGALILSGSGTNISMGTPDGNTAYTLSGLTSLTTGNKTFTTSLTMSGALTATAGTITINSSMTVTVGGTTTITSPATVTNNGIFIASGTFTGTGGFTNAINSEARFRGATTNANSITTFTATANPNTVYYDNNNATGSQTCKVTSYYNLIFGGTGATANAKTCALVGGTNTVQNVTMQGTATWLTSAATTISGNLTISGGSVTQGPAMTISGNLALSGGNFTTTSTANTAFTVTGTTTITTGTLAIPASTSNKTFTGLVTLDGGTMSGASATIVLGAGITNNSGTVSLTGTVTLSTASTAFGGANNIAIANLAVNNTTTNNGTLTVSTVLSGSSTLTNSATGTLNIGGTSTITGLTATANGNTVNYTGAAQTVKNPTSNTYWHLGLSGSLAKTLTSITTVSGNLTMAGTATTTGNVITTITGNLALNGTNTFTTGANLTISGSATIGNGTNASRLAVGNFTMSVGGTTWVKAVSHFTYGSGAITFNGDVTIDGCIDSAGTCNVASASTGNITINNGGLIGTGDIDISGNTVELRSGAAENFGASAGVNAWTFKNLTFGNSTASTPITYTTNTDGTGAFTLTGILTIGKSGDTAITTFDPGNETWILSGTGTPLVFNASSVICPSSTCATNASILRFTGAGATNVTASAGYYDLQIQPNGTTITHTLSAGTFTIAHDLTIGDAVNSGVDIVTAATNDPTISVGGNFLINNYVTFTASDLAGRTMTFSGNFTKSATSSTFTPNTVEVIFDGGSTSTLANGGATLTFYKFTVTTAGKQMRFTAGQTFAVTNLLTLTGAANNLVDLNSTTGSSAWTINFTGTSSVDYVKVTYSSCTVPTPVINATNSESGGNNGACWGGLNTYITVSGNIYDGSSDFSTTALTQCDGSTATMVGMKAGDNALTYTSCADADGAYSFTSVTAPSAGQAITIYINGVASTYGTTVTRYDGVGNVTNLNVQKNYLILASEDFNSIGSGDPADNDVDSDIVVDIVCSTDCNTIVEDGIRTLILPNTTFNIATNDIFTTSPSSSSSSLDGDLVISEGARITSGAADLIIGGDFINSGSLYSASQMGMGFTATSLGHTVNLGVHNIYSINFIGSGGGWNIEDAYSTISGNLTITAGTVTGANNITVNGGTASGNGTLNLTSNDNFVDLKQISAGAFQTCGITNGGKLYCWGGANSGALGNGSTTQNNLVPTSVLKGEATGADTDGTYLINIKQISAWSTNTCAISNAGFAYCWGADGNGQLGNGATTGDQSSPVKVLAGAATGADTDGTYLINIKQISTGGQTCAITFAGNTYCWGNDGSGQLGNGATSTNQNAPVKVLAGAATGLDTDGTYLVNIKQIAVGGGHTCAISNAGNTYCWGSASGGQLGDNNTTWINRETPVKVLAGAATGVETDGTYLVSMKQIVGGSAHTCAISNAGNAYCWGDGLQGKLGNNTSTGTQYTPVKVLKGAAAASDTDATNLINIKQISANLGHTCAVSNAGNTYCWGYAGDGQLGDNQIVTNRLVPVKVMAGVAAGTTDADGASATTNFLINAKQIVAGQVSSCAISNAGKTYCWGTASLGILGDNQTVTNRLTAVYVLQVTPEFKQIAIAQAHTCAISNAGRAYCWGGAVNGALGDNQTTVDRLTPVKVLAGAATGSDTDGTYLINIIQIATGGNNTCAISNAGNAYCWGADNNDQLGNGATTGTQTTPVKVLAGAATGSDTDGTYLINIKQISIHNDGVCALSYSGNTYCWGYGLSGQIGDNQIASNRNTPVKVLKGEAIGSDTDGTYLINIKQIATGTCAISYAGNIYCWGGGNNGRLGNGNTTAQSTPVKVLKGEATGSDTDGTYLVNFKQIATSSTATCAISNAGNAYCWGNSISGQRGNGTTTGTQTTPVKVLAGAATGSDTDGTYLINIKQIVVGITHACAISNADNAYCWGGVANGQVGDNQISTNRTIPVRVVAGSAAGTVDADGASSTANFLINIKQINATGSGAATCAISYAGNIYCWGNAANGRLGNNLTTPIQSIPINVVRAADPTVDGSIFTLKGTGNFGGTSDWQFNNLTFSTASTTTTASNTSTISVLGDLKIDTSHTLSAGSKTFKTYNDYINNGTLTASTSTMEFAGTDSGNMLYGTLNGSSAFYNLKFNGIGGTWEAEKLKDIRVTNLLTVDAGTFYGVNGANMYLNGGATGAGRLDTVGYQGGLVIDGVLSNSADWYVDGFQVSNLSGGTLTASGAGNIYSNDQISIPISTTFNAGGKIYNVTKDITPLSIAGTLNTDTSTFNFIGDGVTGILARTYYNLGLMSSSATAIILPVGTFNVTNDLTIGDGTHAGVDTETNDPIITVDRDFTVAAGATYSASSTNTLTVGRNFTNSGTFTANSGTVNLNTTNTAIVAGNASTETSFKNLTINTAGKTVQFTSTHIFGVVSGGVFTSTGTGAGQVTITSTTGNSQWIFNHQGTESVTYTTISWSGCSVAPASTQITANGTGDVDGGNNGACWVLPAAITISGTIYLNDETTLDTTNYGGTVMKLSVGGGTAYTSTVSSSNFSFSVVAPSNGAIMTIWLNTDGGNHATTVLQYGTSCTGTPTSCTGIKLVRDQIRLEMKHTPAAISVEQLAVCDNDTGTGCNDADIGYTLTGTNSEILTATWATNELKVTNGTFLGYGGVGVYKLSASVQKLELVGGLTSNLGTITISGSGSNTTCSASDAMPICGAGTLTLAYDNGASNNATIIFTGTSNSLIQARTGYGYLQLKPGANNVTYTLQSGSFTASRFEFGNGTNTGVIIDANANNPTVTNSWSGAGSIGITINASTELKAGSGTWSINASTTPFTNSGTFTANTSSFEFISATATTVPVYNYYSLAVKPGGAAVTHTFAAGTFNIGGNLTLGWGFISGAIVTANANSTTLNVVGNVTIANNTTFIAHASNVLTVGGNWTLGTTSSVFTHSNGTVRFNDNTKNSDISGSPTFYNLTVTTAGKDIRVLAGDTITIASGGTMNLTGGSGAGNEITLDTISGSGTWTMYAVGAQTVTYVTVTRSSCHASSLNITVTDGTNGGTNGACWVFVTSGVSISGTANGNDAAVVFVAVNSSLAGQSTTIGSGVWTINGVTVNSGDIVTVFVNNVADNLESTAITKYDGTGNITGMVLNTNVLTIGSGDNGSLTVTNLGQYDFDQDEDIMHSANSSVLLVQGGTNSYTDETINILSGTTFTVGSTETLTTDNISFAGILTSTSTATYNVSGNWTDTGTFNLGASTVTFNSTNTGNAITATGSSFSALVFNGIGGEWTFLDNQSINGSLTITKGELIGGAGTVITLNSSGTPFTNTGIFTADTSTVKYGAAVGANIAPLTYYNLELTPNSGTPTYTMNSWSQLYSHAQNAFEQVVIDKLSQVIYAGTSGSAEVYRCAISSGCDVSGDWIVSYDSPKSSVQSLIIDTANGVLYAGTDSLSNDAIIYRCELWSSCDQSGDWTAAYTSVSESAMNNLFYDSVNSVIYVGTGTGGRILRCATSTACDATGDWTLSYDTNEQYINSFSMDTVNGVIYAGSYSSGIIYRCDTSTACDASGDWTVSYDTADSEIFAIEFDATAKVLYAGSDVSATIYRCDVTTACDASGDWTVSYDTPQTSVKSLTIDQHTRTLYAGTGTGGIIYRCALATACDASGDWSVAYDSPQNRIESMDTSGDGFVVAASYFSARIYGSKPYNILNNLTISSGATLDATTSNITIGGNFSNAGTFTAGTSTVVFNNSGQMSVISGNNTFYNLSVTTAGKNMQFTASSTTTITTGGSLTLRGASGPGNQISISTNTGAGSWTINHQGSEDINYLAISRGACHASSTTLTVYNGTNLGNNGGCWDFFVVTISGVVYQADGVTVDPTVRSIKMSIAAGAAQTVSSTITTGAFSFTTQSAPNAGDLVTIWLNGETPKGTLVLRYGTSCTGTPSCTGLSLVAGRVSLAQKHTSGFTNALLASCDSNAGAGCNTADLGFDVSGSNLTVSAGRSLFLAGGTDFTPGGTVTTAPSSSAASSEGDVIIGASSTLAMGANALSVGGDYVNFGTFLETGTQTTTFTATATGHTIDDGDTELDNVVLNGIGGGWSFVDDYSLLTGDLTVTAGTLSGTTDLTVFGGDMTGNGSVNLTGGWLTVVQTGNFGGSQAWTLNNFYMGGGTTTASGAGLITINGWMSVEDGHNFVGTADITVAGNVDGYGVINKAGGTFTVNHTSTQVFGDDSSSWTFYNLTFSGDAGITNAQYGNSIAVTHFLTIGANHTLNAGYKEWTFYNYNATPLVKNGTLVPETSTFSYVGTVNVTAADYYNLLLYPSEFDTVTFLAGTYNVLGNLNYGYGEIGTVDANTNSVTLNITGNFINDSNNNFIANSTNTMTVGGSWTNYGTFTHSNGTVKFNSTTAEVPITSSGSAFYNLTFDGVGGSWALEDDMTVTNVLTITNGVLKGGNDTTITLSKNGTPLVKNAGGSFEPMTSTVVYASTGATGTTIASVPYYNLNINRASNSFTTEGNILVGNNMTITAGTFVAPSGTLTVKGDLVNNSGNAAFTHNNGTVIIDPVGDKVSTIGGTYNIVFNNFTNDTPGTTIIFKSGNNYNFTGELALLGLPGNPVTIKSDSQGEQWFATLNTANLFRVNILDSGCNGGNTLTDNRFSNNMGNNGPCWAFKFYFGGGGSANAPTDGGGPGGSGGVGGGGSGGGGSGSDGGGSGSTTATATANVSDGSVISITITSGGSGYSSNPTVTISGQGSGASASASIEGGIVVTIQVNSGGSNYTGGTTTVTISGPGVSGGGSGGGGGESP